MQLIGGFVHENSGGDAGVMPLVHQTRAEHASSELCLTAALLELTKPRIAGIWLLF